MKKGEITDSTADEVIGALQLGITEIMNKPPTSPLGKRKWRGPGHGGGYTQPPSDVTGIPSHIERMGGRLGMVQ